MESEAPAEFILTADRALPADGEMSDGDATLQLPRQRQVVVRESSASCFRPSWAFRWRHMNSSGHSPDARTSEEASTRERWGPNHTRVSIVTNTGSIDYFLQRAGDRSPWSLLAMGRETRGRAFRWRAEYTRDQENVLRSIRIVSEEANRAPGRLFDLDLSLSRIQFAPVVGPETFSPTFPAGARRVSLAMVQRTRSRPLVQMSTGAR